jgi:hypothetical protein
MNSNFVTERTIFDSNINFAISTLIKEYREYLISYITSIAYKQYTNQDPANKNKDLRTKLREMRINVNES